TVLDGNLVCSYNVYYWHIFNNHPNYGCKSLEYSQNFRSITVSGLPYLMKNPHFDAVALPRGSSTTCSAIGPKNSICPNIAARFWNISAAPSVWTNCTWAASYCFWLLIR